MINSVEGEDIHGGWWQCLTVATYNHNGTSLLLLKLPTTTVSSLWSLNIIYFVLVIGYSCMPQMTLLHNCHRSASEKCSKNDFVVY